MAIKSLIVPSASATRSPPTHRFRHPTNSLSSPQQSQSLSFKPLKNLNSVLLISRYTLVSLRLNRRLHLPPALDSNVPHPLHQESANLSTNKSFEEWNSWTAKFSGAANIPFTVIQMPQIILNARNLLTGNKTALLAVPWLGMLTGLLGNLSLLSYFVKKREKEAILVQTLGVVSIYVVIAQLAIGEAMPLPHFVITSFVVASGLVLNFLNYFSMLNVEIWRFWEDFITVGGVTVLPQVMWSTFLPYVPNSIIPGVIAFAVGLAAVVMARMGKLTEKGIKVVGALSGWTATLLFMWMPVSQMWTNFLYPDNIKGLSAFSMLLGMIGNALMIPRALFIRDLMWYDPSLINPFSFCSEEDDCEFLVPFSATMASMDFPLTLCSSFSRLLVALQFFLTITVHEVSLDLPKSPSVGIKKQLAELSAAL